MSSIDWEEFYQNNLALEDDEIFEKKGTMEKKKKEKKEKEKEKEKIGKTRVEALNQVMPALQKKKEDSLRQRVDLLREMTRNVDQQADFTRKVLTEVGLFASKEMIASRKEEKDEECREKVKKLSQLCQESAQIKQMAEDNKNLQEEMDQIEMDVMESKETAVQLEAEAEKMMSRIREMQQKKSEDVREDDVDISAPQFQPAASVPRKFIFKRK